MSSRETAKTLGPALSRRAAVSLLAAAGVSALIAGCGFQPLYGTTTTSGIGLADAMAQVDINEIPGRVGQVVRNELIFKTTGGGEAPAAAYRLEIAMRESAQNLLVETDGNAQGLVFALDADFRLVRLSDNQVILTSRAASRAAYQKVESVFANIRGRRDAEDRAAKVLADSIRTRVAAFLSQPA